MNLVRTYFVQGLHEACTEFGKPPLFVVRTGFNEAGGMGCGGSIDLVNTVLARTKNGSIDGAAFYYGVLGRREMFIAK